MVGKNFIRIQKSLTIREKMDKLKFFSSKNVFSSKDAIKKKKGKLLPGRKYLQYINQTNDIYKNIEETKL